MQVAEEVCDAPAELLTDDGRQLQDALKGYYDAARALYHAETKWLAQCERDLQEALREFVELLKCVTNPQEPEQADVTDVSVSEEEVHSPEVEVTPSGPSPLFAAFLGCLVGGLATSSVGRGVLFAAGCLLASVIAYKYVEQKVPQTLKMLNVALNEFLEEKGLVLARGAGQGFKEGLLPAQVASDMASSVFDVADARLPNTTHRFFDTVDPRMQQTIRNAENAAFDVADRRLPQTIRNAGNAAFDLADRRLPQTARLTVQEVGNTAAPWPRMWKVCLHKSKGPQPELARMLLVL